MNSLQHRCIVNLVDAFDVPPEMVLVSELVCGGELFERLVEEEEIAEVDVTFYIKQVLQAVGHIHGQGILHLDLKVWFYVATNTLEYGPSWKLVDT